MGKRIQDLVDKLIKYRYLICLIVFILLVLFKISGSSIPYWDQLLKDKVNSSQNNLLLGKARGIRSDEWLVQTPYYLSQVMNEKFLPLINSNIRSTGQNMLLSYYAPVFDITLLGKPFNWGFMLGREYGLSWYWCSKLIISWLLSFELSMFLTNRNKLISLLGAFWIAFSPAIQWWFSTAVIDLIIYAQAMIVSTLYYFKNPKNKVYKFINVLIFTSSGIGYVLTLYPPIQVPLGYFVLIVISYTIYKNKESFELKSYDTLLLLTGLLLGIISVIYFAFSSLDGIKLISSTIYPGKRFSTGGDFDFNLLQSFLISWKIPFRDVNFSNNSEISSFINFFPIVFLTFFKTYKLDKEKSKLMLGIFIYTVFLYSWLVIPYPSLFAKVTLFSYAPPFRAQLVVNLIALYLSIWQLSILVKHKLYTQIESLIITFCISALYFYAINHSPMVSYLSLKTTLITLIAFGLLNYLLLNGMKKSFVILMAAMIIVSGFTVNPISQGLGSIYNKKVSQKIMEINASDPGEKWMSLNSLENGNLLLALGCKTFNSVHYYPDITMWQKLDSEGKFSEVYNRYAHIEIKLTNNKTDFQLSQVDFIKLYLNPADLRKTDVKYLLSVGDVKNSSTSEVRLNEIYHNEPDNLYIYKIDK